LQGVAVCVAVQARLNVGSLVAGCCSLCCSAGSTKCRVFFALKTDQNKAVLQKRPRFVELTNRGLSSSRHSAHFWKWKEGATHAQFL